MKNYRFEIIIGLLLLTIIPGLIFWFGRHEPEANLKIIVASVLMVAGLVVYLLNLLNKRKDVKANIPVEDEFIKYAKLSAGARSFHLSIYLWLLIFIFNGSFHEREEMLGLGILGSALIYGICFWYYRSTGNFDEKQD